MKKCNSCGKVLPDDAKVCTQCGSSVISESVDTDDTQRIYD